MTLCPRGPLAMGRACLWLAGGTEVCLTRPCCAVWLYVGSPGFFGPVARSGGLSTAPTSRVLLRLYCTPKELPISARKRPRIDPAEPHMWLPCFPGPSFLAMLATPWPSRACLLLSPIQLFKVRAWGLCARLLHFGCLDVTSARHRSGRSLLFSLRRGLLPGASQQHWLECS